MKTAMAIILLTISSLSFAARTCDQFGNCFGQDTCRTECTTGAFGQQICTTKCD